MKKPTKPRKPTYKEPKTTKLELYPYLNSNSEIEFITYDELLKIIESLINSLEKDNEWKNVLSFNWLKTFNEFKTYITSNIDYWNHLFSYKNYSIELFDYDMIEEKFNISVTDEAFSINAKAFQNLIHLIEIKHGEVQSIDYHVSYDYDNSFELVFSPSMEDTRLAEEKYKKEIIKYQEKLEKYIEAQKEYLEHEFKMNMEKLKL